MWFTGLTAFMLKTPNQSTLELASRRLCAVIATEYKWAEEYWLYTGSIFHPVVKTQSNDCCRHHSLRETLRVKFCPFRIPLPQLKLLWLSVLHNTTSALWESQPGEHLHHHPLRAITRFFSYTALTLAPLAPSSKMGIPIHTHLVHM